MLFLVLAIVVIIGLLPTIIALINRKRFKNYSTLLSNDVILTTGAAGGIGEQLAHKLLQYGPKGLILWDNDAVALENLYSQMSALKTYHCIYYSNQLVKLHESNPNNVVITKPICLFIEADVTDQFIFSTTMPIVNQHFQTNSDHYPITILINNNYCPRYPQNINLLCPGDGPN